jgi:hypothetical protein
MGRWDDELPARDRRKLQDDWEPWQELDPEQPIPRKRGPRNRRFYPIPPMKNLTIEQLLAEFDHRMKQKDVDKEPDLE